MGKYFGTDGFRGEANKTLTFEHAIKIGRFLGWYYGARLGKKAKVVIGKDTRRSGYMLETALNAGFTAVGIDISDRLGAEKPSPVFFDAVFAAIGPIRKDEVMIVGDSLTSDICGGDNAGIVTVWYNPAGEPNDSGARVDHELRDLREVEALLG